MIVMMKIVSYNVNGLRRRLASFRTLRAFLDALDADIICLQETKISRQELTADIAVAEGYESFFSCTRTVAKGRLGYSGVATFCRIGKRTSKTSAICPLAAYEGFTGALSHIKVRGPQKENQQVTSYDEILYLEGLTEHELLQLDSEGRCLVTDHGSFVLFNIYGPRVGTEDPGRQDFKLKFFKGLQSRWEGLLNKGRAIIALGDFNISPYRIDSCKAGPDFDQNRCRRWLRSILQTGGGPFYDVFRSIHPDRKEAFTCWSTASGAEKFNYGSRIDLVLVAGPCTDDLEHPPTNCHHNFIECEVEDCDIRTGFKRWKSDSLPRLPCKAIKMDGSDHAPVYVALRPQPPLLHHEVPALAARFMPEIRGRQQSLVSFLQKKPTSQESFSVSTSNEFQDEYFSANENCERSTLMPPCRQIADSTERHVTYSHVKELEPESEAGESLWHTGTGNLMLKNFEVDKEDCHANSLRAVDDESGICNYSQCESYSSKRQPTAPCKIGKVFEKLTSVSPHNSANYLSHFSTKKNKRTRQSTLRSFVSTEAPKRVSSENNNNLQDSGQKAALLNIGKGCSICTFTSESSSCLGSTSANEISDRIDEAVDEIDSGEAWSMLPLTHDVSWQQDIFQVVAQCNEGKEESVVVSAAASRREDELLKKSKTLDEWTKLKQLMAKKLPLCKGHGEPCVRRVVKNAGPNIGRGFYVCARAEGPPSNPEARCDHFEWTSKEKQKRQN